MKELEFIEIIKNTLSKTAYIGDDCAHIKSLDIVVTQDSLVEDIHFSRKFSTPNDIAYKAIIVNLSDIFASGAIPKYITISLSLPHNIEDKFIKEFYEACEDLSNEYDFEVIGGDITGSDKIFISVCAIGSTKNRQIASRSYAKAGDYVITSGTHGSSAAGLWLLENNKQNLLPSADCNVLIAAHQKPIPQKTLSNEVATKIKKNYAMMDTSDGLADALFKVAQSSNLMISVEFDKILYDKQIESVANLANDDYKDWVLYGGEDYQLVACIDENDLKKLDSNSYKIIGQVKEKNDEHFVEIIYEDHIQKISNLDKTFNHFQ